MVTETDHVDPSDHVNLSSSFCLVTTPRTEMPDNLIYPRSAPRPVHTGYIRIVPLSG